MFLKTKQKTIAKQENLTSNTIIVFRIETATVKQSNKGEGISLTKQNEVVKAIKKLESSVKIWNVQTIKAKKGQRKCWPKTKGQNEDSSIIFFASNF